MSDDQRLPRRPYLLRAMHQWMSDAGMTPHVLVDTYLQGALCGKVFDPLVIPGRKNRRGQ